MSKDKKVDELFPGSNPPARATKEEHVSLVEPTMSVQIMAVSDSDIPSNLGKAMEMAQGMLEIGAKLGLLYYWNAGKVVSFCQKKHGKGTAGMKGVMAAAEAAGMGKRLVQEALRFYNYLPDDRAARALEIEWAAVREVMRLPDNGPERERMIKRIKSSGMSVKDAREEVSKRLEKKGGRSRAQANNLALVHFRKTLRILQQAAGDSAVLAAQNDDMLALLSDSERTSEEAYAAVVEGIEKEEPLLLQIDEAQRLVSQTMSYFENIHIRLKGGV